MPTTLTALFVTVPMLLPQGLTFPFHENFSEGAAQRWHTFGGHWMFESGELRQTSAEFDCGAAVAMQPSGSFYLSVRFVPHSDFTGAGLFFALPQLDKRAGGVMVRCDPGGRIIWGWFDDGGVFDFHGDVHSADVGRVEQELAVAVDAEKLAMNVFHNGQKVAGNILLPYTAGFVGLQSSGGAHSFTHFEVRPAQAAELDGLEAPGTYGRVIDLVGDSRRIVALRQGAQPLVSYDEDGNVGLRAYLPDIRGMAGRDWAPVALSWDAHQAWGGSAGVLVLAERGRAIYRFDNMLRQVGNGPVVRSENMRGTGLTVGPNGHIFVADAALPGIRVFTPDGKELLAYGEKGSVAAYEPPQPTSAGKFGQPAGIAIGPDGVIVVTDRENCTYVVYRHDPDTNELKWVTNGPWLPRPSAVRFDRDGHLLLAGTFEYYQAYGALRVLTLDGLPIRSFVGHALGNLSDQVRACEGPAGRLYLSDPQRQRIVVLPPQFVEKLPRFEWTEDGGVRLIMTKVDGTSAVSTNVEKRESDGRIVVRQSEPVCLTWPPSDPDQLPTYALPPKPPAGQMYVIDFPVLVTVFTKVRTEEGREISVPGAGIAERLARELEHERRFYWLNSRCVLNKRFEIMVVEDQTATAEGGWIESVAGRRLVNQVRAARGLPTVDEDHSLAVIHAHEGFDPQAKDDVGFVGGGGLTNYAYSGYALWNNGQGWLMGHEWGHQLDMYFEKSGFADWWLNHPDGTVHVGRYGEHWDCNAFLCRRADTMNWLRLRFGTLRLVADADADGLPDDDPTLPLDEKRFGSDPRKMDTDDDGLTDLQEAVAGTFTSADPTKADSDGDGIPDGADPHPAFAVADHLRRATTSTDGQPTVESYVRIGQVARGWCEAAVYGTYDADHVYLLIALPKPARQVWATFDFNNDGWFIGRDNLAAHVDLDWPAGGPPGIKRGENCVATLHPAGLPIPGDLLPAGCPVVALTVKRPPSRMPLEPGSALGLCVRLQNGGGTVAFLLDPWQLLSLALR